MHCCWHITVCWKTEMKMALVFSNESRCRKVLYNFPLDGSRLLVHLSEDDLIIEEVDEEHGWWRHDVEEEQGPQVLHRCYLPEWDMSAIDVVSVNLVLEKSHATTVFNSNIKYMLSLMSYCGGHVMVDEKFSPHNTTVFICHSLWTGKRVLCPPSGEACLVRCIW